MVTTANVTDRKGCLMVLECYRDNLVVVKKVLVDGGYTGATFASSVEELNRRGGKDRQTQ